MCLIGLALEQHPRFALVIAANRDEFLQRPATALDWWRADPEAAPLLGGRDLHAGGTWMGLNAAGRVAMLTNVRDVQRQRSDAPSRGAIVPDWLAAKPAPSRLRRRPPKGASPAWGGPARATAGAPDFWRKIAGGGHNPFNLLAGDMASGQWWWADDRASDPTPLAPGLYGLSNAALDTPWPKVQRLKGAMAAALADASQTDALETALFAALADATQVPDAALPDTGIGLDRERWLAPAFIRTPDARYGTRCSTLLIAERDAEGLSARVVERQFAADGSRLSQRSTRLRRWSHLRGDLPRVETVLLSAG